VEPKRKRPSFNRQTCLRWWHNDQPGTGGVKSEIEQKQAETINFKGVNNYQCQKIKRS